MRKKSENHFATQLSLFIFQAEISFRTVTDPETSGLREAVFKMTVKVRTSQPPQPVTSLPRGYYLCTFRTLYQYFRGRNLHGGTAIRRCPRTFFKNFNIVLEMILSFQLGFGLCDEADRLPYSLPFRSVSCMLMCDSD
jgi:hypothetical protein